MGKVTEMIFSVRIMMVKLHLLSFSFPRHTAFLASFLSRPVKGGPPFNISYLKNICKFTGFYLVYSLFCPDFKIQLRLFFWEMPVPILKKFKRCQYAVIPGIWPVGYPLYRKTGQIRFLGYWIWYYSIGSLFKFYNLVSYKISWPQKN